MDDSRSRLGRWLKVGTDTDASLRRWMRGWAIGMSVALVSVVGIVTPTGFFRKQARLRDARALVMRGFIAGRGPLYEAIKEDHVGEPALILYSPANKQWWSGSYRFAKRYAIAFTYEAGGKRLRHTWLVDLEDRIVQRSDGE